MRRASVLTALALAGLLAVPAPAMQARRPLPIIAPPSAITFGFMPDAVTIPEGGEIEFWNLDPAVHDLTIDARDRRGYEVYRSGQATVSETLADGGTPVARVSELRPGTYSFFCSVHTQMRGELTVQSNEETEAPTVEPDPVDHRIVAGPAAVNTSYANSDVVLREGDGLLLTNFDMVMHSVTSLAAAPDGMPLFDSDAPGFNGTARVEGVERLAPGEYRFQCFFHSRLRGRLTVLPRDPVTTTNHTGRIIR